jgi:hypothetical protein
MSKHVTVAAFAVLLFAILLFAYIQSERAECSVECQDNGYVHSHATYDKCVCLEEVNKCKE